jgi:hypothetical protein
MIRRGTGSLASPFLTIQAALTSITDASVTKPYCVYVFPGIYSEVFTVKAFTYIEGASKMAVILAPVQANWIDASFAAGTQDGGIGNCTFRTDFAVNFATVVSLGAATFKLRDILLESGADLAFTGNNASNIIQLQNIFSIGATSSTLTITSINVNSTAVNMRNGTITIASTDAYAVICRFGNMVTGGAVSVTWTGAVTANFLGVTFYTNDAVLNGTAITISGAGAQVAMRGFTQSTGPDANTTFSFGVIPNGGTVILPYMAFNTITSTPTAPRTYTFERPTNAATRVLIINKSAFAITIAYAGGASGVAGQPTWVPANSSVLMISSSGTVWETQLFGVQKGTVTLTNGISVLIPCDLTTQSSITFGNRLPGGTLGDGGYMAFNGDRVNGTRAGGGGFKLTSIDLSGTLVNTDSSQLDWEVS